MCSHDTGMPGWRNALTDDRRRRAVDATIAEFDLRFCRLQPLPDGQLLAVAASGVDEGPTAAIRDEVVPDQPRRPVNWARPDGAEAGSACGRRRHAHRRRRFVQCAAAYAPDQK